MFLDQECGPLTLHSSLKDLVIYTRKGLSAIDSLPTTPQAESSKIETPASSLEKRAVKKEQVTQACKVCGVVINVKSMKRHVRNIHEKRKADGEVEIPAKRARR